MYLIMKSKAGSQSLIVSACIRMHVSVSTSVAVIAFRFNSDLLQRDKNLNLALTFIAHCAGMHMRTLQYTSD